MKTYKLIVADNSPSVRKVVQMAFPEADFEVYPFEDGMGVMNSIHSINPDAVLLSFSLPGKDGYEVGSYLRSQEKFKQTALVLLKGAFEPLDKEKIAGLEHDGIVQEPFDSERLVRVVRELIEKKKKPKTLPEELDEVPLTESQAEKRSLYPEEWREEVEEKIRTAVRQEILGVQRELEKRVKAQVVAEIKSILQKEKEKSNRD